MPARTTGVLVWLVLSATALGQDLIQQPVLWIPAAPPPAPPVTAELPEPPQPYTLTSAILPAQPLPAHYPLDTAGHLRKAADHLEAAGLTEEASRYRAQAAQAALRAELQEKLVQLAHLQDEVNELQRTTGISSQVQLTVTMLDADAKALAAADLDLRSGENNAGCVDGIQPSVIRQVPGVFGGTMFSPAKAREVMKRLEELQQSGHVKKISAPRLVTLLGQPATVRCGGEIPFVVPAKDGETAVEWRDLGVRLHATPTLLSNGKLRLELQAEASERNSCRVVEAQGLKIPGVTTRRINAEVEVPPGHTVALSGLRTMQRETAADGQCREKNTEMIVLITADFVEPPSPKSSASGDRRIYPAPLPVPQTIRDISRPVPAPQHEPQAPPSARTQDAAR